MMLPQSPIGIVIVSLNTRELLRGCLESLRNCTLPVRIVVVDNGSTDGSQAIVAADFPEARLIEPTHNLGFGAANNLGVDLLLNGADVPPAYVLLLNPDTIVRAGAIETLARFLAAHPRVGLVGPRLLNPDHSIQSAAFRFPTLVMTALDLFPPGEVLPGRLYGSWWHGRYPQEQCANAAPFPIDHPLGACMLIRRAAWEAIGGFDRRYFMYSEEIDLCWRLRTAGWAIWQVPHAQVTHYGGAATSQFRQRMFIALYGSRFQFAAQHRGAAFQYGQRLIVAAGLLRATLRTWRAYAQGRISRDDLRAHLWAFGSVMRSTTPTDAR